MGLKFSRSTSQNLFYIHERREQFKPLLKKLIRKSKLQAWLNIKPKLKGKHIRSLASQIYEIRNWTDGNAKLTEQSALIDEIRNRPVAVNQQNTIDFTSLDNRIKQRAENHFKENFNEFSRKQREEIVQKLELEILRHKSGDPLDKFIQEEFEWLKAYLIEWEKEEREKEEFQLYERQLHWLKELQELEPHNPEWAKEIESVEKYRRISVEEQTKINSYRKKASEQKAEEYVRKKEIMEHICPGLQTISNDAFEITKVITPILLGLAVTGTISIPMIPILFASIGLVIARMGTKTLCANYDENDDKKK